MSPEPLVGLIMKSIGCNACTLFTECTFYKVTQVFPSSDTVHRGKKHQWSVDLVQKEWTVFVNKTMLLHLPMLKRTLSYLKTISFNYVGSPKEKCFRIVGTTH